MVLVFSLVLATAQHADFFVYASCGEAVSTACTTTQNRDNILGGRILNERLKLAQGFAMMLCMTC